MPEAPDVANGAQELTERRWKCHHQRGPVPPPPAAAQPRHTNNTFGAIFPTSPQAVETRVSPKPIPSAPKAPGSHDHAEVTMELSWCLSWSSPDKSRALREVSESQIQMETETEENPSPAAVQFSSSTAEDVKNWCWCTKAQRMGRKDRNYLSILNLFLSVTLCWDVDLSFLIFACCNYFCITFCSPHSNHCLKPGLIQLKATTSKLKPGVSARLLQCREPMIFFLAMVQTR